MIDDRTTGERVADSVAKFGGSWPFIFTFLGMIVTWMVLNTVLLARVVHGRQFDPYPYIALNLALSAMAGLQAPIIMMSQNRQAAIDRDAQQHDYDINCKAELEIELLHHKVDLLREKEIAQLIEIIQGLEDQLRMTRAALPNPAP
jgi:uncharacterized membrane protein